MKVSDIVDVIDRLCPPHQAQDWDNVGLLVGDGSAPVTRVAVCVDLTAAVLADAIRRRAELIIAYHPVIMEPLSRVTAQASPVVYKAVKHGISVYSMHTAFDVVPGGTNDILGRTMGLKNAEPLERSAGGDMCKIVVCVPPDEMAKVAQAAFAAGAGRLGNYYDCAFFSYGVGGFCGGPDSHPAIGQPGERELVEEMRLEMIVPRALEPTVCDAIRRVHSYELPAIDAYPLLNCADDCGMGRVGDFDKPLSARTIVARIKRATGLKKVLVATATSGPAEKPSHLVATAACGAGSCGDLYKAAIAAGATFYLTGEMKHHDLLAATAAGMTVVCLGHSNSERISLHLLSDNLAGLLAGIKIEVSRADRDPLEVV
jgi:dinuclear metal center YbgI/SA1388 family protein